MKIFLEGWVFWLNIFMSECLHGILIFRVSDANDTSRKLIESIVLILFFFSFYRPLRPIAFQHSLHHSSLSFTNSSGLSIPSIRKLWINSSTHLCLGLPRGILASGFQFCVYFITLLDLHTCSSQLIFLPLSVFMALFPKVFSFIYSILFLIHPSDHFS